MKKIIPLFFLLILLSPACQEEQKPTIRFCSYFDVNTPCEGEFDQFPKGSKVWIYFELGKPSKGDTLTGQLYVLDNGKKSFVSEKEFIINPGEDFVMDLMIFGSAGKFVVEFIDSEGNSLAAKEIEIR